MKISSENKQLLLSLLTNTFPETNINQHTAGQTKVTILPSEVVVNVYDTGTVTIQGKTDSETQVKIQQLIDTVNLK